MPCAKGPSPPWSFDLDQSPEDRSDSRPEGWPRSRGEWHVDTV